VLAHDHLLLRQGIRRLLEDEPDIEIVAESVNAAEALRHIFEHRPDVVIAGSHLFDGPAKETQGLIKHESPESTVVFLSFGVGDDSRVSGAQVDGATFVVADTSVEEFVGMIRGSHPGHASVVREMPRKVSGEWQTMQSGRPRKRVLTAREREVLKLLAEGRTVRSAAEFLGLSIKTVDAHKFNLMRKLGIHNKAELVMWAIQKRIVKLPANF
jgi:two-component system response regulator NreC